MAHAAHRATRSRLTSSSPAAVRPESAASLSTLGGKVPLGHRVQAPRMIAHGHIILLAFVLSVGILLATGTKLMQHLDERRRRTAAKQERLLRRLLLGSGDLSYGVGQPKSGLDSSGHGGSL